MLFSRLIFGYLYILFIWINSQSMILTICIGWNPANLSGFSLVLRLKEIIRWRYTLLGGCFKILSFLAVILFVWILLVISNCSFYYSYFSGFWVFCNDSIPLCHNSDDNSCFLGPISLLGCWYLSCTSPCTF